MCVLQERNDAPVQTTGNSFEMTMANGHTVKLYHCDAAAMANIIPRTRYGTVERGGELLCVFLRMCVRVFF